MLKKKYIKILIGIVIVITLLVFVIFVNMNKNGVTKTNSTTSVKQSNTIMVEGTITVKASIDTGETDEIYSDFIKNIKNALSGNNKNMVWAYVNNRPIYKWFVLCNKAFVDMNIAKNLNVIGNNVEERKKYLEQYQKTDDEVLDSTIKNEVIKQEAEKIGIKVKNEDVIKDAKVQIENFKKLRTGFFDKVLDAFGYTEEQYLNNITIPGVIATDLRSRYYQIICPVKSYKDNESRKVDFEKHIQQLIKKYNIKKTK